jgi:ABC-type dipeptide/oligopeptide/nickel transport system ATPase subunit
VNDDVPALNAITIRDLRVVHGDGARRVAAVEDVSFAIAEGETYGIVGESGSGKSSILRVISGLNRDWSGYLLIRGQEIGRRRAKRFYKTIQMVFQDPYGSLHPRKSVEAILYEGLAVQNMDDRERRIDRVLYDVGMEKGFRYRYPHQLSGGQRQRIAIARALIMEPRILLLDEPTSALDVSVQAEILNLLVDLRTRRRLTCILVSHNLAVVAHMCERIAVMNRGRIVEELDSASLRAGIAKDPYTLQLMRAARGYDRATADSFIDFA